MFFYNLFTLNLFHVLQEKKTYDPLYVPSKIYLAFQWSLMNPKAIVNIYCWIAIGPKGQCGSPCIGQLTSLWSGRPLQFFSYVFMLGNHALGVGRFGNKCPHWFHLGWVLILGTLYSLGMTIHILTNVVFLCHCGQYIWH